MAIAKFLQISDLHLGARFGWLSRERREQRRREQQRALERAVQLAIERGAHALLVPGDLFDRDDPDPETLAFAIHAFEVAGCPPVFVAPGNHDPWSESSPAWGTRVLAARGWTWPGHVHVFASPTWTSVRLGAVPVRVWGRCHTPGMASTERPLDATARAALGTPAPTELHVAVFHGSLEGHCPPGQKMVAPFSLDEAHASPFAWLAVGHYHRGMRNRHFAYSGSPIALDLTETGAHGVLEIRVEYGAGPPALELDAIAIDERRAHALEVDVTGAASADQVDRRILDALDGARVEPRDLVRVRLTGRLPNGVRYESAGERLADRVFELKLDRSGLRPDYDLAALRHGSDETTEARFARVLLERLDAETDPEARARIERAVYYGLDAFRLGAVTPAWEEIGP